MCRSPVPGAALLALVAAASPARAADESRERALEARVRYLEQRLLSLETRLDAQRPPTSSLRVTPRRTPPRPDPAPAAGAVERPPPPAPATPAGAPPQPSLGVGKPADAPQEAFVFRQNAVTLRPSRFEADFDLGYVHNNGFLQTDRAAVATTSVRVGVLDWLELGATVPAFATSRSRVVGPFRSSTRQVAGLGDAVVQANARLHEQTPDTPGVVASVGALLPTGPEPYDFAHYQPNPRAPGYNPNPTNLGASYLSRGAWGVTGHVELYKTVDPVILFAGVGANYLFPQAVAGRSVQAGVGYNYNLGLSLALSERSTVGVQLEGGYQDRLTVNHRVVPQSELEPVAVRVSVIQRVYEDTWVEPAFAAGLTNSSPGLAVDVGLRHRF